MSIIRCTQPFFSLLSCDQLVLSIMCNFKKEYFRVLDGPEIVISQSQFGFLIWNSLQGILRLL